MVQQQFFHTKRKKLQTLKRLHIQCNINACNFSDEELEVLEIFLLKNTLQK